MFIKIQKADLTVCYTGDQYAFNWRSTRQDPDLPGADDAAVADITVWRDEKVIIDYPLKKFSYVYIMNDQGKTIDTFDVR